MVAHDTDGLGTKAVAYELKDRVLGAVLSMFVKESTTPPAPSALVPSHAPAFLVFATSAAIQLAPISWRPALAHPAWGMAESLLLAFVNGLVVSSCAIWFWIYFADRSMSRVSVAPGLFRRRHDGVALKAPETHPAQFILVTVPLMLATFTLFTALTLAQLGYAAHLMFNPSFRLPSDLAACRDYGSASHRIFLSAFASFLGSDNDCLKLQSASALGAYFLLVLWMIRALFAVILFGVFVQFGTVVVRRK